VTVLGYCGRHGIGISANPLYNSLQIKKISEPCQFYVDLTDRHPPDRHKLAGSQDSVSVYLESTMPWLDSFLYLTAS